MPRASLALIVGLMLLLQPFMQLWMRPTFPWFVPYLVWGTLIGLARFGARGDGDGG